MTFRSIIRIYISYDVDQKTGKPKIVDITIPEEYRRFLHEKSPWRDAYMQADCWIDTAESLYDVFPRWKDVEADLDDILDECGWSEQDHNLFGEALKWFASQSSIGIHFMISWE